MKCPDRWNPDYGFSPEQWHGPPHPEATVPDTPTVWDEGEEDETLLGPDGAPLVKLKNPIGFCRRDDAE